MLLERKGKAEKGKGKGESRGGRDPGLGFLAWRQMPLKHRNCLNLALALRFSKMARWVPTVRFERTRAEAQKLAMFPRLPIPPRRHHFVRFGGHGISDAGPTSLHRNRAHKVCW